MSLIQKFLNTTEHPEGVCYAEVDYNETMDSFDINVFVKRREAGKGINSVYFMENIYKHYGDLIRSSFSVRSAVYIHFGDC